MGQYYYVVNIDKRQFLHPHKFGDGLKLMEFANSDSGTLCGLAVLLADGNGRGGGDLHSDDPLVGSWAGDRIVVAGDYADGGKYDLDIPGDVIKDAYYREDGEYPTDEPLNLHTIASLLFEDISDRVIRVIAEGDGPKHPLSKLNLAADGWRTRPAWNA